MKQFKTFITRSLVITSLMLPWATTAAQDLTISTQGLSTQSGSSDSTKTVKTFDKAGVITKLGYNKFTVDGKSYRFSPNALLDSNDSSRQQFSDFKPGDVIYFKGKILSEIRYVDIVYYKTPEPT